jgi:hypothetical protein
MTFLSSLSVAQLRNAVAIKEQIEHLEAQLASIVGETTTPQATGKKRRRMSAVGRAKIAAAARARWAKIKRTDAISEPVKVKRKLSAAHKRKLIKALAKARKIRLAGLKAQKTKPVKKDKRSSPATRAKLAAAARARWAKVKAEGKKTL